MNLPAVTARRSCICHNSKFKLCKWHGVRWCICFFHAWIVTCRCVMIISPNRKTPTDHNTSTILVQPTYSTLQTSNITRAAIAAVVCQSSTTITVHGCLRTHMCEPPLYEMTHDSSIENIMPAPFRYSNSVFFFLMSGILQICQKFGKRTVHFTGTNVCWKSWN